VTVLPVVLVALLHVATDWVAVIPAASRSGLATFTGSSYWMRHRRFPYAPFQRAIGLGLAATCVRREAHLHILTSLDHLGPDTADRQKLLRELAAALDANDPYLNGHSRCVARWGAGTASGTSGCRPPM
jgi:hypothetical protein